MSYQGGFIGENYQRTCGYNKDNILKEIDKYNSKGGMAGYRGDNQKFANNFNRPYRPFLQSPEKIIPSKVAAAFFLGTLALAGAAAYLAAEGEYGDKITYDDSRKVTDYIIPTTASAREITHQPYNEKPDFFRNFTEKIKPDLDKHRSPRPKRDNPTPEPVYNPTPTPEIKDTPQSEIVAFDTGGGDYPSIPGEHKGNFTPKKPMEITKIYTYPSAGTGGHTEKISFFYLNDTLIAEALWNGYNGDWHNITFPEQVSLKGNETYKYLIKTGSYPQIHHKQNLTTTDGIITCTEFTDANGKKYNNWIPAFRLYGEGESPLPDTTPPNSVTGLNESELGQNYIKWAWANPQDPDFLKTMIYLNDQFLTNLSKTIAEYNATGLDPDTEYKLGIKTVDETGNINQSIAEDYAKTLKTPNQNPIPVFTYNPENPKVNQSILFNASDSYDPDGEIDQYLWDFNNDNITDAVGKTQIHSYSSSGIKQAILKVIDNEGGENQTSREINVLANQVPIVDIGGPYSGEVDEPVYFEAYATDQDGNITKYTLEFGDGTNVTKIVTPPKHQVNITENHNYTSADIYNAILKVIDDDYESGTDQTYVNITEPQINKTWAEMDFNERKALTEQFLAVDPTPYAEINHCLYIADRLYQNATNAKELYGLEDDIPMCLDHFIDEIHIANAVLLGNNESDICQWGFIGGGDKITFFDKNVTLPFTADRKDRIWENGRWITPDELYRLTNYSVGFDVHWEPNQKSVITVISTYPYPYQDVYPF